MRRIVLALAAVAAVAAGAALPSTRADAMTIPGGGLKAGSSAEKIYLSCTRYWNGYRWIRRCVEVGGPPVIVAPPPPPPPVYYAPRPYYYGPRPWGWY